MLQKELGFPLVKRGRGGVKLTAEGERLMPSVRALLASAEQLSQTASSIRGLDCGTVRIGAFTSVAVHWLPAVLKEFQTDYPNVDFKLLNGDYHDVEQWLSDGSVDIGFVNVPCALDCECITLMEDRLLAILPLGSRFASYPKFPLVECETEPFISLLESSDHDARRALEAAGVQPNVRFYTKDDYAIIAMVEQGLGISIMPELLLKGRNDKLQILPLIPEAKRAMQTGWQQISGKWYYFNSSGVMQTGWLHYNSKWYYFDSDGAMLANTSRTIGSKEYHFDSSGVCTNP